MVAYRCKELFAAVKRNKNMDIKVNVSDTGICGAETENLKTRIDEEYKKLCSGNTGFTGWVKLPFEYDREELEAVIAAADEIKKKCRVLIVVGIGGSYLGTRAVAEALGAAGTSGTAMRSCGGGHAAEAGGGVRLVYAGNNMSAAHHVHALREMIFNDVCLCVVSKSGETAELKIGFSVMKEAMILKYGEEEAKKRIYVVTDREKGSLREEAEKEGYTAFAIPQNVGGRYSVLTPAGLLPLAAAGIDVRGLLEGAAAAAEEAAAEVGASGAEAASAAASGKEASAAGYGNGFFDYAAARYLLGQNKSIEVFEHFEPQLQYFAEWLKQLFGESEGKEGKGIFPASLSMSSDLHSMGQFLQEGSQCFFETVLNVVNPITNLTIPQTAGKFGGRSMHEVNAAAQKGMIKAHREAGIPVVTVDIPELSPQVMGQLIYFFEISCAVYCGILGVNAFNQPGVERYKEEMKKELEQ